MHIGGALHRQRTGVSPIHLAEILASTEHEVAPVTGDGSIRR
jgi:L-lactate dehydrogenase complex protein LldE